MQITKLEYQQNNSARVNVYIDNKFALGLSADEIISLGLYKGQEISSEQMIRIVGESNFGKLLSAALRFLAVRQRSKFEVYIYLGKVVKKLKIDKESSDKLIEMVIDKLVILKMIDDKNFANWLVASRRGTRPKGQMAIEQELKRKGVSTQLINESIGVDGENRISEMELAKRALEKKVRLLGVIPAQKLEFLKLKARLQRYLVSKGFDWEIASGAVEQALQKE